MHNAASLWPMKLLAQTCVVHLKDVVLCFNGSFDMQSVARFFFTGLNPVCLTLSALPRCAHHLSELLSIPHCAVIRSDEIVLLMPVGKCSFIYGNSLNTFYCRTTGKICLPLIPFSRLCALYLVQCAHFIPPSTFSAFPFHHSPF